MTDHDRTTEEFVAELTDLRQRIAALETAEEELAKSRAVLHAAIDCLPFEFFAIGTDGRYFLQNAVLRDHYGDAVGKRPEDFAPNERSRQVWLDNNRRAFAGERVRAEIEAEIGGRTFYYDNVITPIRLGGRVYGILGVNVDITERKRAQEQLEDRIQYRTADLKAANRQLRREIAQRKRAEDALRKSERRFRNYFEQGLIGMGVTSVDKRWLEVNDRLCEILGCCREELLQGTWTELTHPDDLGRSLDSFNRLLRRDIEDYTLDKRFLRKDGTSVYTTLHVRAFRDEDGSIDHVVALIEDITERKLAEEALEHERRTLERMLRASDHERRLIAYDIHDGLAQQLAGAIMQFHVYAHARQTKREDAARAFDAAMKMLQQCHAEVRRLISGVRPPILDESGVMAAIAHLIHEPSLHGPKIDFRSRVAFSRLAPVLENVIYRIVQEGLTNARNHSKSEKVRISLTQRGNRLRIEIRDWGVGFDPQTTQENRFGLEGIRERARLLGGKCRIKSKPGEGTSITVELPVVEQEAAEQ